MKNFTARGLRYSTHPINIDDMWYTPRPDIVKRITYKESSTVIPIIKAIESKYGPLHKIYSLRLLDIIRRWYQRCKSNDEDVSWLEAFNPKTQREVIYWYVAVNEYQDHWQIVPHVPFNDFGYVLMHGGMISHSADVFNLYRLLNVRQLAALHNPVSRERNPATTGMTFSHNRLVHSYDACALMGLIILNNQKELFPHKDILRLAAVTHDWRTPAFGDTTKWIDPKTFNEDTHYKEIFDTEGWQKFNAQYGLDEKLLFQTINGKGLFGQLLDYADKISYTARDLYGYLNQLRIRNLGDESDFSEGFIEVCKHVERFPFVCNVWQTLRVHDGQVFSVEKHKLAAFLKVRALMFKNLYFNPVSRFPEYVISQFVLRKMYEKGIVTAQELLVMGDQLLEHKISDYVGIGYFTELVLTVLKVKIESFNTLVEAEQRVREIITHPDYIAVIDPFQAKAKTGLDNFLVSDKGKLKTVREACPGESEMIEHIMIFDKKFRVYSFSVAELQEESRTRFHELVA